LKSLYNFRRRYGLEVDQVALELGRYSIAVKGDLPGLGKNLQDHLVTMAAYSRKEPGPFQRNMRLDRVRVSLG
jgi:4-pyridoxate dehydrogenase